MLLQPEACVSQNLGVSLQAGRGFLFGRLTIARGVQHSTRRTFSVARYQRLTRLRRRSRMLMNDSNGTSTPTNAANAVMKSPAAMPSTFSHAHYTAMTGARSRRTVCPERAAAGCGLSPDRHFTQRSQSNAFGQRQLSELVVVVAAIVTPPVSAASRTAGDACVRHRRERSTYSSLG